MREANAKVEAVQRGHVVPGSVAIDANTGEERAPIADTSDPDDIDARQNIGAELDGFLYPGHHRVSGGWDGPDD